MDIDFDDASIQWRKNKKYIGNGYFTYTCNYIHSNGKQCRKTVYSQLIENKYLNTFCEYNKNHPNAQLYCKKHYKWNQYKA
jgi:hypothetical protein